MMKRILKASVTTISGLLILMVVTTALMSWIGSLATGGIDNWKTALKSAAPYLFIFRLSLYSIVAVFWAKTYRIYREKDNQAGLERTRRIGLLSLAIILLIEMPKILGGG